MDSFDDNHKKILSAFITLKTKCTYLERHTFRNLYMINKNRFKFVYANTFYSHMRDICDLSIVFMINEEVSNAKSRNLCGDLLCELLTEKKLTGKIGFNGVSHVISEDDLTEALFDIRQLMRFRINQMVGSHMHDFSVSAFSAFEKWISKLYSSFSLEFDKQYHESKLNKTKKLLERYVKATEQESKDKIVDKLMKLPGSYVSFPDKLNAVLKKLKPYTYPRDLDEDKRIIEFLRIHRNTVHNGGIHHGKPISIKYRDVDFTLETGKPLHSHSWLESIEFTGELLDIYTNIVTSIEQLAPDSYCSFQEDPISIVALQQVVSDFRHSDKSDLKATNAIIINFLKVKMKMTDEAAHHFMSYLDDLYKKTPPEQDIYLFELLTKDLTKPFTADESS